MDGSTNKPNTKDVWDKLGLLGGPLIALVGIIFTWQYNAHQDQAKAMQSAQADQIARSQLVLQRFDVAGKYYSELMNHDNGIATPLSA